MGYGVKSDPGQRSWATLMEENANEPSRTVYTEQVSRVELTTSAPGHAELIGPLILAPVPAPDSRAWGSRERTGTHLMTFPEHILSARPWARRWAARQGPCTTQAVPRGGRPGQPQDLGQRYY